MKNKKISLLVLSLSMAFILACGLGVVRGSGKVISETRDVSGFDRVEIHDGGNLYLVQGDSEALEIEAEENIMPYLSSRVVNHTLFLEIDDSERRSFITTRPINYYLTMEDIHGLAISGGGDIEARKITTTDLETSITGGGDLEIGILAADTANMRISGGGNIDIEEMKADLLEMRISGGGDVRIHDGKVGEQRVDVSGGGNYRASDLKSDRASAEVSGGGDLTVWVEDHLDIELSGGGSVYYYGDPTVNSSISGGGDIVQRDK